MFYTVFGYLVSWAMVLGLLRVAFEMIGGVTVLTVLVILLAALLVYTCPFSVV